LDKTAGEIGVTPKYDKTDLFVILDLRECAEFLRWRGAEGACVSGASTSCNAFSVLMMNLFSFLKK